MFQCVHTVMHYIASTFYGSHGANNLFTIAEPIVNLSMMKLASQRYLASPVLLHLLVHVPSYNPWLMGGRGHLRGGHPVGAAMATAMHIWPASVGDRAHIIGLSAHAH